MIDIQVVANGSYLVAKSSGEITSGMVGIGVNIEYDKQWATLNKTAFFKSGNFVRKREGIGIFTTVPWEVLRKYGNVLEIGLEGRDSKGEIVMPTVWATVGTIRKGAQGEIPAAPNPDANNNEPTNGAVIDDSKISANTTWSSQKISEEIEGAGGGGGGSANGAVLYTKQTLTTAQQTQARQNIGAADAAAIGDISTALDSIIAMQEALIGGES